MDTVREYIDALKILNFKYLGHNRSLFSLHRKQGLMTYEITLYSESVPNDLDAPVLLPCLRILKNDAIQDIVPFENLDEALKEIQAVLNSAEL